jgi:hypothetical protein
MRQDIGAGGAMGMWDVSLLYIGVVVLIVAIGFVFALRMGMSAALDAERGWAEHETAEHETEAAGVLLAAQSASSE